MVKRGGYMPWALALIFLMAFLVRVWPIYRFAIWGSDSGEYLLLTQHVLETGSLHDGEGYLGFGFAYPFFQGMEVWAGAFALAGGLEVQEALWLTGPLTAGLAAPLTSLLALYLLTGHRQVALLSGGVVAVALPHVFATSHSMPGATGETLALVALLIHLRALDRPRWYPVLVPVFLALLVTHHFSLYFYVIGAFGIWAVHGLFQSPARRWEPTRNGLIWFSLVSLVTSYYWLVVAQSFGDKVLGQLPIPLFLLVLGSLAGLGVVGAILLRWPRQLTMRAEIDSARKSVLKIAGFVGLILAATIIATIWGLPGTGITLPPEVVLIVLPLVGLLTLSTFPRQIPFHPKGHLLIGWLALPMASLTVAVVSASHELISYRHMPYLMEPLALCVGVGALWIFELVEGRGTLRNGIRPVASIVLGALVLFAGLLAYPPPEMFGGFQEGTNEKELDLVNWATIGIRDGGAAGPDEQNPRVVTDHRLSTFLFGIAGASPTWDLAGGILHGEKPITMGQQLRAKTPGAGSGQAGYIVLTEEVILHAALAQWEVAAEITPKAQAKFQTAPFWRIFDNGEGQVYMVDLTLLD